MKKKDLLNEIAGVPRVLDTWVDIITTIIFKKLDDILIEGWDKEASGEIENPETGELETHMAYASNKEYIGKDMMKEIVELSNATDLKDFINSKTFQEFPLWQPTLVLKVVAVPDIHFNKLLEQGYGINARVAMDPKKQELSKLGKNEVVSSVLFEFDPILPASVDKISPELKDIMIKSIRPVIAHELLHTYQSYMQMRGGKTGHFGPESILNALSQNPLVQQEFIHDWNEFLRLVYLHLSFEVNARVNELYYEMKEKGVNTKEEFLRTLKESHIWKEVNSLKNFDAENFIKDFEVHGMVKGNDHPLDFLEKMMVTIELKGRGIDARTKESTLKSLINVWDSIVQLGAQGFEQAYGIKIPMGNVPQKAKENPLHFFKFFEKRFHKKAKKFERKLYRLASIVLNQEKEVTEGVKKKALNEIAGVPNISKWNSILAKNVMNFIETVEDENAWEKATITIGNNKIKTKGIGHEFNRENLMDDVVKTFTGSDKSSVSGLLDLIDNNKDYKELPIWRPTLKVQILKIPKSKYPFNKKPVTINAGFTTSPDTKIKDGKLHNVGFYFNIYVQTSRWKDKIKTEDILKELYPVISHEVTHAYQFYNQLSNEGDKNATPKDKSDRGDFIANEEMVLNIVQQRMKHLSRSREWGQFLNLVYLHLSFEINARVSQLGHELLVNGIETTEDFKRYVNNSETYKEADSLTNFNAKDFVDKFDSPIDRFRSDDGKEIGYLSFWEYLQQTFSKSKRSKHMLKSLIGVWSKMIADFDMVYDDIYRGVPNMEPVPDYAKEDPIKFFEFFEKRFHEKGEEFKRKLYKLGSLVQKLERNNNKRITTQNGREYPKNTFGEQED